MRVFGRQSQLGVGAGMSGEDEERGESWDLELALGIWVMVHVQRAGARLSGTGKAGGQGWGSRMVDKHGKAG